MRYGSDRPSSTQENPFATGAAVGAAGTAGAMVVGQKLKSANAKANWGLGIGVVLTALAAVSSSDLNADQSTAQNLATQAQAMPISNASTATLATLAADVQGIRSHLILQDNLLAKMAYDANFFSFSGTPVQQNAPVQSGAITPTATTTTSSNNGLIIVAIAALVVLLAVLL